MTIGGYCVEDKHVSSTCKQPEPVWNMHAINFIPEPKPSEAAW